MNADIGDFPHAPCSWIPACARMTESAEIIGVGLNLHHARRGGDDRGGEAFFRGIGLGCIQRRATEAESEAGVAALKSVASGQRVSVRVDLGGGDIMKIKKQAREELHSIIST